VSEKKMLNRDCKRENRSRTARKENGRLDFDYHASLLTPQEAEYEASRCLGTAHCEACDICRLLCPDMAITRDAITGQIVIDLDYCKGCGICAFVCPKGAITMVIEQ
jgi:2-oxoacid:acceptor oxidoreductase delta subunit (pyruvate/2-ketoisovalerate family)